MKILFSSIKKLVPELKADPHEVGRVLSMIGFLNDGFEEVKYIGKKDVVLDFEVRQNRADCLSVIGLAREVAAYYGLRCVVPRYSYPKHGRAKLGITVPAGGDAVRRIVSLRISGVKNSVSPAWLKEFVELHGINSINILVDLSNYAMLMTGYPSHLFDTRYVQGSLSWAINKEFDSITTLDGTKVRLPGGELLIRDDKHPLSTTMVGGDISAVRKDTTSIIVEIAIYDHALIRRNSRALSVVTEASHRLEKLLDPNGAAPAMQMLSSLIVEHCGGVVDSSLFEYYPKPRVAPKITFDTRLPASYAGIPITHATAMKILKRLRFVVAKTRKEDVIAVTVPSDRMDVALPEDVVEEVVRMVGFDTIPSDEVPDFPVTDTIGSPVARLAEEMRDMLVSHGYDEIRSIPLAAHDRNASVAYRAFEPAVTENSVNEEFPELRVSIAAGLFEQYEKYVKRNLEFVRLFEIGRVFGCDGGYHERTALGALYAGSLDGGGLRECQDAIQRLLRHAGASDVRYGPLAVMPSVAHPHTAWEIRGGGRSCGIMYKLQVMRGGRAAYFFEIDLDVIVRLQKPTSHAVHELTEKLVMLDANVSGDEKALVSRMDSARKEIGVNNLWSMHVVDAFPL